MPSKPDNLSEQQKVDRASLKGKTYEARVELLREIGPKYRVEIIPPKEGKHSKDQARTLFTRICQHHGPEQVRLSAFLVRGKFGCSVCAQEKATSSKRKGSAC